MHFVKLSLNPPLKKRLAILVNHFFCSPFPQAMLSVPKMTRTPDINIASGGGGGEGGRGKGKIRQEFWPGL